MTKFSADEAFEMSEAGEPIMLDRATVRALCFNHGTNAGEFWNDTFAGVAQPEVDAARVLGWLGY